MRKMSLNRSVHKWLSAVVGIQLIIWVATGLYFNVIDHDKASGNENRQAVKHQGEFSTFNLLPVSSLNVSQAKAIKLIWVLHRPYYQVMNKLVAHGYQQQESRLFNAVTGQPYQLSAVEVKKIAQQSYLHQANISDAELLHPPIDGLPKHENPVWKVSVEDALSTVIFIDHATARVIAHQNDDSRLRDLMFKLHFMDYANNGSFNHWLIIIFAVGALLLSVTGGVWVVNLIKKGQLSLHKRRKRNV